MMQVLTGDQSYSRETMSLAGTLTQARRREDAERREQGVRTPGAKNKRKGFYQRPKRRNVRVTYEGDFKDGKFNGKGKYTYEST